MKEKVKRNIKMQVYLTQEEYDQILQSSNLAGLSVSRFARNVCLGSKIESLENHHVRREMLKVNGDLGRLGGLLKLALTETDEQINIRPILRDIERTKDILKKKIMAV